MTTDEPTPVEEAKVSVTVTFDAKLGMSLAAPGVSIVHMWAAAELIRNTADQMWQQYHAAQAQRAAAERAAVQAVRQQIMNPLGRKT